MPKTQKIKIIKIYQCGHQIELEEEYLLQDIKQGLRSGCWHFVAENTFQILKPGPCPACYGKFLDSCEKANRPFSL